MTKNRWEDIVFTDRGSVPVLPTWQDIVFTDWGVICENACIPTANHYTSN